MGEYDPPYQLWAYGRFIEIQSNLRKKEIHITNFFEAVLAIEKI